jgi:ferredoxin--NADP+ reductase
VDDTFGLPVRWNAFVKHPEPHFPVDGLSYEAYDPDTQRSIDRVFVAGWSREASSGLVGLARKDGENGAQAVLAYLQTVPALKDVNEILKDLYEHLSSLHKPYIDKPSLLKLEAAEQAEKERLGVEMFKYGTNEEMLKAMGLS